MGWVPFLHIFQRSNRDQKFGSDLDYDDLTFTVFGRECKMLYEFSETTLERLILSLVYFPELEKSQRTVMNLGNTVDAVKLNQLLILEDLADKRLDLKLTAENYISAIKHTFGKNLEDLFNHQHPVFKKDLASWAVSEGKNDLFRALLQTKCADPEGEIKMNQSNCKVFPVVYFCLTNNYIDAVLSLIESGVSIQYDVVDGYRIQNILANNKKPWQMLRILRDHMPQIMYDDEVYARISKFIDSGDTNSCYSMLDALGGIHTKLIQENEMAYFSYKHIHSNKNSNKLIVPAYSVLIGHQESVLKQAVELPDMIWIQIGDTPKPYSSETIECFNVLRDTLPFPFGTTQMLQTEDGYDTYLDGSYEAPYDLRSLSISQNTFDDLIAVLNDRSAVVKSSLVKLDKLATRLDMFKDRWRLTRNTNATRKRKRVEVLSHRLHDAQLKETALLYELPDDFLGLHAAHIYAKGRNDLGGTFCNWHQNGKTSRFKPSHASHEQMLHPSNIPFGSDLIHSRVNLNLNEARKNLKVGDIVYSTEGERKITKIEESQVWVEGIEGPFHIYDPDIIPKDVKLDLDWEAFNGFSAKYEFYFTDIFNQEILCYIDGKFVWGHPTTTEHIFVRSVRSPGNFEPFDHPGVVLDFHSHSRHVPPSIRDCISKTLNGKNAGFPPIMNITLLGILPHQLSAMSTIIPWFTLYSEQMGSLIRADVAFRPVVNSDFVLIEGRDCTLIAEGDEVYFVGTRPEKSDEVQESEESTKKLKQFYKHDVKIDSEEEMDFNTVVKPNTPITDKLSQDENFDFTPISKGLKTNPLFDELKFESTIKPFLGFWYDLKTRTIVAKIRREKQFNNRKVYLHWTDHTSQLLDIDPSLGGIRLSRKGRTLRANLVGGYLEWEALTENAEGAFEWKKWATWSRSPVRTRRATNDTEYTLWKVTPLGISKKGKRQDGALISLQTEDGRYLEVKPDGMRLVEKPSKFTRIVRNTITQNDQFDLDRIEITEKNPFVSSAISVRGDTLGYTSAALQFHASDRHGNKFERKSISYLPQATMVQVKTLFYENFQELRTAEPGDLWCFEIYGDVDLKLELDYYAK